MLTISIDIINVSEIHNVGYFIKSKFRENLI